MRSSGSPRSDPGAVRAFLAAALDEDTRSRIDRLSRGWPQRFPGIRPVPPANAHLTLRFLGAAATGPLECLARLLATATASCAAAVATAEGLALFPERGAPRVLALTLALPAILLALQRRCEEAAREAGFEPELRPFRPHVTLGRWNRRVARPSVPPLEPFAVPLGRVVLYRSDARPGGVAYTPLATFPLAG